MGTGTTNPTASGTMFALPEGFASNDGVITENNENLNGRMSPTYAGITTTLSADILNATTDEVNITNIGNYNINIGDYLMVDDEIIRVKTTTNGGSAPTGATNPLFVFRGVLELEQSVTQLDLWLEKYSSIQLNLEDTLSFVLLDIHLNMLDLGQVTTQLHFHKDKIVK